MVAVVTKGVITEVVVTLPAKVALPELLNSTTSVVCAYILT